MSDTASRTIIICVVLLAVAVALGFGLPLSHLRGPESHVVVVFLVVTAATLVTLVVWLTKRPAGESPRRGFEVVQPAPVADVPSPK